MLLSVTDDEPHWVMSTDQTCYDGLLRQHSADNTHWFTWKN